MELTRTDSVPKGDTLTAYDFAMEEVTGASSRLAHALLARAQKKADATTTAQECSNARSVYEKMIHLFQGCGSTPHNAPHFSKSLDSSGRGSKRAKPTKGSPNQPDVRTSCRQLPISPAATAPGGRR